MTEREIIGPPECPLFHRWTLLEPKIRGRVPFKVMLHHFMPNRQDADVPHDHPRSFVTLVLRGGYDDLIPDANGDLHVGDHLSAPTVRFRRAEHAHMTRTDDRGAWTLVIMGPERRPWGFWREGKWWHVKEFERIFGFAWRCADPDEGIK
jgi:hypothetical protein